MSLYGNGVPQDYAESGRWYRKAAEHGNALAEQGLGWMYFSGNGVPQDYHQAAFWYRQCADQGCTKCQVALASMYFDGTGLPQDYFEAARWYRAAAEQGDPDGQSGLALLFREGNGLRQDFDEALRWYRKAASQGNGTAEYALGYMYYTGQGLPRNYVSALNWFHKAAEHGNPGARAFLRALNKKSSARQLFDYAIILVAFMGGIVLCADQLVVSRRRKSLAVSLVGIASLCYAGLRFYAVSHDDLQYSAHEPLFRLVQIMLVAAVVLLGMKIVLAPKKRKSNESGAIT